MQVKYTPAEMPPCEQKKLNCNKSRYCWKRNEVVCSILNDTHFNKECPFYKEQ